MSDFSLFSLFTAGLACLVPLTAAYTQPVGSSPEGNPISEPGLNSIVPAGKGFTITWEPTTKGTVTLVLLKGPSSNAVPQYAIVEKTDNDGSYVWTPSTDLAPTEDATGYGIQLIVDSNGQYQYTTQFGISNPDYKASSSSSSSTSESAKATSSSTSASVSAPVYSHSTTVAPVYTTDVITHFTTYCPEATTFAMNNHTYSVSKATTLTIPITKPASSSWVAKPTGASVISSGAVSNVTMIAPTGWQPSTIKTTASASASSYTSPSLTASSSVSVSTGGSAKMASSVIGLVFAAGVAVFAV